MSSQASFSLDVRVDIKKALASVSEEQRRKVMSGAIRSLNRTGTAVRVDAAKRVATAIGMKPAAVKRSMFINKATRKNQRVQIVAVGRHGVPLSKMHPVQTAAGVQIRSGSMTGQSFFPHAFIIKKFGKNVYEREGRDRLPIRKLYGPSIPSIFISTAVKSALMQVARTIWQKNFHHEMDRILHGD